MNKKILRVVLGMHRSGTSVITRSLQVFGGAAGSHLMEAWTDNPKGYWEDLDIVNIDNEMLEFLGMDWQHLRRLNSADVLSLERTGFSAKAAQLIDSRLSVYPSFIVKDPRMAGLIKFWKGIFSQGEYQTDFVLAIRNPHSVVQSLARRNDMPTVQGFLLWLGHTLDALSESVGFTRAVIDYDRLLAEPETELRRVADELHCDVDETELAFFKDAFIDLTLRHEMVTAKKTDETDELVCLADDVYQTLLQALEKKLSLDGELFLETLENWEQRFRQFTDVLKGFDSMQQKLIKQSESISTLKGQLHYTSIDLKAAQELVYRGENRLHEETLQRLESEREVRRLEAEIQRVTEGRREYTEYLKKAIQTEKERARKHTVEQTVAAVSHLFSQQRTIFPFGLIKKILNSKKRFYLQMLQDSALFDFVWYFQENPAAFLSGANPVEYYLVHGGTDQKDPHPLFQSKWYLSQVEEEIAESLPPLLHYLCHGEKAGLQPNPCFHPTWYRKEYSGIGDVPPLRHYVLYGEEEGKRPCPCFEPYWYREKYLDGAGEKNGKVLAHYLYQGERGGNRPSPLFDPVWYRQTCPDVAVDGQCLLGHYLNRGEQEGYRPDPFFFPKWYAVTNPEIAEKESSLLQHYVDTGEAEGRLPNPLFFPHWYLQQNPDLNNWQGPLLCHYIEWGEREGRHPSPLFFPEWYRQESGVEENILPHYLVQGEKEGLRPNPLFHPRWYGERNPDLIEAGVCLLSHYIQYGEKEGRQPAPHFFPQWYRQHYMSEGAETDECALRHFLTVGDARAYRPGPFFDSEWYLEKYIDLDMQGLTPYRHYSEIGQQKGFECAPWPMRQRSILPVVPVYPGEEGGSAEWQNAAIHLHLLSLNSLFGFVERLRGSVLPLYITVDEELWNRDGVKSELAKILAPYSGQRTVEIRSVPSAGRGTSALLLEYREEFSQFEYIGHFTLDEEIDTGCEEAFDLLLGTGNRFSELEGLFAEDATLVYTECERTCGDSFFPAINRDIIGAVLSKYSDLDIEDYPEIDQPAIFMFWTKLEVLEKFWDLPFSYHNFAVEKSDEKNSLTNVLQTIFFLFAATCSGRLYRLHRSTDSVQDCRRFEERRDYSDKITKTDVKVLSYYLPQFHPTPENDKWHGSGFTEWTKVRAATPLFRGHWQQHIPHEDIGYYLLESPEVLQKQAELMKGAGVTGMIFYHYWFTGRLILESPAQMLLAEQEIEMPFCFCWANENWTKKWDGNDDEILLGQEYSEDDAEAFIRYLIPFFRDRRYIKVDGRPMLHVYRPTAIPEPEMYLAVWKRVCEQEGVAAPWVVATLTRGAEDPRDFGMDAAVERVLHDWTDGGVAEMRDCVQAYTRIDGSILNYPDVADYYIQKNEAKEFTYFRSVVPCWDNTARYGSSAYVLHNPTPEKFQHWLDETVSWTRRNLPEERRFLVVNAWNEWAEGNHLEADSKFGYAWLNCVGRSLAGIKFQEEHSRPKAVEIPAELRIEIRFTEDIKKRLKSDSRLAERFFARLENSTLFSRCRITTPFSLPGSRIPIGEQRADYILEIQRVSVFNRHALENMVMTALYNRGAAVIPNAYGADIRVIDAAPGGAVDPAVTVSAPLVLKPVNWDCRRVFLRTDALAVLAGDIAEADDPEVSCIIRFHRSGLFADLDNALLCLQAMGGCRVQPFITAQDLDEEQKVTLQKLVDDYHWELPARVKFYHSSSGRGDLRSKMMNEALREVTTRYAAFLDADDRLFSHAWSWLAERLQISGKAVAFARVYRALASRAAGGVIWRRVRTFEYGTTYEDFLAHNHSPVHSFLLDLSRLDLRSVIYHDDQKYMEDYFLLLQLVTPENSDRRGLEDNFYIGDYLFCEDQEQTLALTSQSALERVLESPEYIKASRLITALVKNRKKTAHFE
ncbi:MAG: hypothetical protein CSA11_00105 [Chloroflexi bacterium]|nr:MAG: hypothetical protein CSA11_00105 [Chloroflexota bacterium]